MPTACFRVAAVQTAPVFLNLQATVETAAERIGQAAAQGAEVVVFPETWLTGYPVWIDSAPAAALWDHGPAKALFARLFEQSPTLDGPEIRHLHGLAHTHGCDLVLGLHERDGGTLYNTMALLGRDGQSQRFRRKLVPTYTERMLWGRGDGSTLEVLPTERGALGGMICWEHWMPALRQVMHDQQELVHVAQWPTVHDLHQLASRQYAFEGGCFVVASGGVLTKGQAIEGYRSLGEDEGLELLEAIEGDDRTLLLRGGSAIIAPDTSFLAGPVFEDDTLVVAEIDPALAHRARLALDVSGHYARPDVFTLQVDRRRKRPVEDRPTGG